MARRRLKSSCPELEWVDPDVSFKRAAMFEREDRKAGVFPYDNVTRLTEFYKGKDILITGAVGFIGKVLVEKLLRSLPEGGKLYLMVRSRRGLTPEERVRKMFDLALFKSLLEENPDAPKRIVVIEGDSSRLGIGLSQADRQSIIDNVSIVFHCAANVRFDMTLSKAVIDNVRGTREVVQLVKEIKKLDVFVYVSTTYSNATYDKTRQSNIRISEEVTPMDIDWRTMIALAEKSESDTSVLDLFFTKVAPKYFNTYIFSKALAENLVEEECRDITAIIVRPSVVIATYEDPFPGWVDNLYGPMTFWDGIGRGVVRTMHGIEDQMLEFIPVDICVKIIIVAAWHRGLGFRTSPNPTKIDVIHSCTGDVCKNTFRMLHDKMQYLFEEHSHRYIFRYPRFFMTQYYWLYWLAVMTSHVPLGIFIDTLLRLAGRKPLLLHIYRKLHFATVNLLSFATFNEFDFDSTWQWITSGRLPKEDRDLFSATTKSYTMDYYHDNIRGIVEHIFNEKACHAKESNRRIMYVVDWIQNVLLLGAALMLIKWLFPWK